MSEMALKKSLTATTSSNVVYLPRRSSSQTVDYDYSLGGIIGNPHFEEYLKDFIEGYIEKSMIDNLSLEQRKSNSPFDSVYLAELIPDQLSNSNIINIKCLSDRIIDYSDSIQFNDEWDD